MTTKSKDNSVREIMETLLKRGFSLSQTAGSTTERDYPPHTPAVDRLMSIVAAADKKQR